MADKKISDLTSLSSTDVASADIIPIVDITAGETKGITYQNFFGNVSTASITTLSGTSLRIGGSALTETSSESNEGHVLLNPGTKNMDPGGSDAEYNHSLILRRPISTDTSGFTIGINSHTTGHGGDSIATFDNTGVIIGPPGNIQLSVKYTGGSTVASMQNTSWNSDGDIYLRNIIDNAITGHYYGSNQRPQITFPADGTATPTHSIGFDTLGKRRLTISNSGLTLTNGNLILDHVLDSPFVERRVGINKASPEQALDVVGNIKTNGTILFQTEIANLDGTFFLTGETLSMGSSRADAIQIDSTQTGTSSIFQVNAITDTVTTAKLISNGDTRVNGELAIGQAPTGGHALSVNGNANVGSTLSSNTLETTNAVISGNLTVNTNAADSPPNSPFSAPVFKVNATTERVGINKAIPAVELDVVGDVTATGSITGATLGGTLSTATQTNITSVGTIGTGVWQGTAIADDYISSASTWNGKQDALTFGLSSGNALKSEEALTENDVLLAGASNVKGRTLSELKSDLSLNLVENTAISTFAGSSNITTVGTISTGTWQGAAIANVYVADLPTSKITSGTFADARISSASVTQHKATMFSNPTFTGNVDLSRIAGNNEIKIEPDENTSHNLILKAGSQTGQVDGVTPPSGGDITIQAGESANQDGDGGTTTGGGSVLIKGGEGGDSGGGDGDQGAAGGNVTIEGGERGGGNAAGDYGQINIGVNNTEQVNIGSISNVVNVINSKAPTAGPTFTGNSTFSGDVTFEQGANRTIKIARVTTGENGNNLTIEAGQFESGTEGNGGSLTLKGGSGDSGDGNGGDLILQPGAGETGGTLYITGSNFQLDGTLAESAFRSAIGAGTGTYDNGSIIKTNTIQTHASAILNIYGSSGTTAYPVNITGGSESGDHGSGAGVEIKGGQSGGDSGDGGDVTIQGGSGETTNGKVILGGSNTLQIDVNSTLTATGIIKSERINVNSGKLYVDNADSNFSVKLGAYGQGTFFGKDGAGNAAKYTLAVGTAGKICEDVRVDTFKLTGNGFLNLYTAPKTLIASPGAGRAIVVHNITVYVDHSGSKGTDAGGFDTSGQPCYAFGTSALSSYTTGGSFYAIGGLPQGVLATEAGDFIWSGEPDADFRTFANRALLLRSGTDNNITNVAKIPGGAHYIKVRYQILNLESDFRSIPGLTTFSS